MELAIDEDSGQWFLIEVETAETPSASRAPADAHASPTSAPPAQPPAPRVEEAKRDDAPLEKEERAENASSAPPPAAPAPPALLAPSAEEEGRYPSPRAAPAGDREPTSDPRAPTDAPTPTRALVRQLRRMKIKELRALLQRHGQECRTCVEKDDLVGRVLAVIDESRSAS